MKEMEGKTCLITGATSGIGSSAALKLSDMGADICFIARSQEKAKKSVSYTHLRAHET